MKQWSWEKIFLSAFLGFVLFFCATAFGDWIVGPLLLKIVKGPYHTWSAAIPYLVENGSVFLFFRAIVVEIRRKQAQNKIMRWWLINPMTTFLASLAYFLLLDLNMKPAPVLYEQMADDISGVLWVGVTFPSALFPLSAYLATIGVWRSRKKRNASVNELDVKPSPEEPVKS